MRSIIFDVFLDDRFVCTMKYKYDEYYGLSEWVLREYVVSRLPTLKGKDFTIHIYGTRHT